MAQGNRRDEKMRSDRGEWDRKERVLEIQIKKKRTEGADLRGERKKSGEKIPPDP